MTTVAEIPLSRMYQAQFAATARLQLWFTGETHRLLLGFAAEARDQVLRYGNKEGALDSVGAFRAQGAMLNAWGDALTAWVKILQGARRVAGTLPFGGLCEFHQRLVVGDSQLVVNEARVVEGVFDPQIRILLDAAAEHLYGDGLNLSGRIWRLDRETRDGMAQILSQGVANGSSAWDLAGLLEVFLGANQDCPRWTSTRLYGLSKKEIAKGDLRGLLSGDACDGRGVSYNALRLARTEIQKMHALATDKVMAISPWVLKEQINLSAGHPEPDICDEVVAGGENGQGVYPKGTIELPLHPNCLCYKTAVQLTEEAFIDRLRSWMKGEGEWTEMDDYEQLVGGNLNASLADDPALILLGVWLFGEALKV